MSSRVLKAILLAPAALTLACAGNGVRNSPAAGAPVRPPSHDRAFFEAIKRTDRLPEGVSANDVLVDLEPWLGAPDPELRDGLAATLCARWIRGGLLSDDEMRAVLGRWKHNLEKGVGEKGDDGVLLRSFSALSLDAIAARDIERPFLDDAERHDLVTSAIIYLAREQDLRGFEPRTGWIHATAHTADLLRRLSRNPALCEADQDAIVGALEAKLTAVPIVFTHGENRRLAQVLVAVLLRKDCRVEPIEAWIGRWRARNDALWNAPVFDHAAYVRVENETQLFHDLLATMWSLPTENANAARVREVMLAAH